MSSQSVDSSVLERPLVICGPSGTGKSTLLKRLFDAHPGKFGFSISHSTRSPRPGEQNGREYHFVEKKEFMDRVENGEFLEWAQFGGNCYGTTFAALGELYPKRCILDIELQGVKQFKKRASEPQINLKPVFLFLSPPTVAILKERLRGRGTETDESVRKRLDAAKEELKYAVEGGHDLVLINDDLDRAEKILEKIAMGYEGWEKCGDVLPEHDLKELEE